jgi:hypothetical protein
MVMAVGTSVVIKYTTLRDAVVIGGIIDDMGVYQVKVQYTDNDGNTQVTWFTENQLQV